jgi:hypothetical protein
MKRAVQKDLRTHLRAASRMEETIANIDKHGASPEEDVIIKLLRRDIQLLNETLRALSVSEFHKDNGSGKNLNRERRFRRKT